MALRIFLKSLSCFNDVSELWGYLSSIENSNETIFDSNFQNLMEVDKNKKLLHAVSVLQQKDISITNKKTFLLMKCVFLCDFVLKYSKLSEICRSDADKKLFKLFIFKYSRISMVNSHEVRDTYYETSDDLCGSGLFPCSSFFNHSCAQNTFRFSTSWKNILIVIRPIKAGEQVFDNYG
jgi:hypothetical protein